MPKVLAQGKTIECDERANLRKVLLENGIDLYNGSASLINCRGISTCGTCAVKVEKEVQQLIAVHMHGNGLMLPSLFFCEKAFP